MLLCDSELRAIARPQRALSPSRTRIASGSSSPASRMGIKLLLLGAVLSVVDVAAGDRFGPVGADRFERQAPASAVDATPDYDSYYGTSF